MRAPLLVVTVAGALLLAAGCAPRAARTETTPPAPPASTDDRILLTVFLRHDQSRSLAEIQRIQDEQGFYKEFPPAGTRVLTWHVVMGIGQVVTLELPASKLRDVNVSLERTAWKAFRTEYFATYDLWPVVKDKLANPARVPPP
jgi:hypothetical protein